MAYELCKNVIDPITIIYEDGTTDTILPKNVLYFSIEKDFFNDFLPVFYIKCLISPTTYRKINSQVAKYKVSIKKFFIKSVGERTVYDKNNKTIVYKKFINDVFINVNNSDTSMDTTTDLTKEIDEISERTDLQKESIETELLLFKESSLDYKNLNDQIFSNTDVCHAILSFAQLTDQNKLLLSYPDNKNIYSNIIIPGNLTFLSAIKYIQSVYGIYNYGYLLFNDFNKIYLIDKQMKCTAYEKNEYERIYINYNEITNSDGNIYGQYDNKNKKAWELNCINDPNIQNLDTSASELIFENLYTVDTVNGRSKSYNLDLNKSINSNTKIIDNKYNNNFIFNSLINETKLKNYTITINLNEIDLDILTPNKEYYLNININKSSYKKLQGLMKLGKLITVYEKKDDDTFSSGTKAIFYKP